MIIKYSTVNAIDVATDLMAQGVNADVILSALVSDGFAIDKAKIILSWAETKVCKLHNKQE